MLGDVTRWWSSQKPLRQLAAFGSMGLAAGFYFLVVERTVPGAILIVVTFWQVGCLAVSTTANFDLWEPRDNVGRFVKRYVVIVHSVRYGRGQRILRVGVALTVAALAAATILWTFAS